jgi:SNF2 family DNA or RNA helicase
MRKLQAVLKAILLRRTKTSLIDGKPIINLPPKTEEIQHVVFSEEEQAFYNALENKTQIQFNKYLRAGTVGKNYSNVLVLLLRLRQACCHPHLIMDFDEAPPAGVDLTAEAMLELAKSLDPDVVNRLLAAEGFEVRFLPSTCHDCLLTVPVPCVLRRRGKSEYCHSLWPRYVCRMPQQNIRPSRCSKSGRW